MVTIEEKTERFATTCKKCNRLLLNPGYGRNQVFCCGKYRDWTDTDIYTYEIDNGRDEKGRFNHKPSSRIISIEKVVVGGN